MNDNSATFSRKNVFFSLFPQLTNKLQSEAQRKATASHLFEQVRVPRCPFCNSHSGICLDKNNIQMSALVPTFHCVLWLSSHTLIYWSVCKKSVLCGTKEFSPIYNVPYRVLLSTYLSALNITRISHLSVRPRPFVFLWEGQTTALLVSSDACLWANFLFMGCNWNTSWASEWNRRSFSRSLSFSLSLCVCVCVLAKCAHHTLMKGEQQIHRLYIF